MMRTNHRHRAVTQFSPVVPSLTEQDVSVLDAVSVQPVHRMTLSISVRRTESRVCAPRTAQHFAVSGTVGPFCEHTVPPPIEN